MLRSPDGFNAGQWVTNVMRHSGYANVDPIVYSRTDEAADTGGNDILRSPDAADTGGNVILRSPGAADTGGIASLTDGVNLPVIGMSAPSEAYRG